MHGNRVLCLFLISFLLFSQWCATSDGNESPPAGPESLLSKYHGTEKELEKNSGPVPFYVESSVNKNASRVDIYGIIKYPFGLVQNELLVPSNWCQIVLPHPNVRACTYQKVNDTIWLLNIYRVDKFSEPLEDAYQMKFKYRVSELQPSYFDIALTAHEGPSHTKDHQFGLQAIPLDEGRTFIHLRYSFGYSALEYFLMKIFGGGKTGFSVVGTDSIGNPVYAGGLRGAVERDVVCYYLAILSYLDTLKVPAGQRFEKRVSKWYDLAALYKKQLLDMEEEEYLTYKRQDRRSQQQLQSDLNR
ncbi:MAG: hypothetical protein M0Z61_03510 [Nitrospiraceae bacterium]|nr:hypothetical protein [Nitrospiraceae bacterium]